MRNEAKNLLIGVFVLAACGLTVWVLLFIHPSVGDSGQTLTVRFSDVDKVNIGTRVTYAGRPVGEVVDITTVPDARTSGPEGRRRVFIYELTLMIDSSVEVYKTDEVTLRTSGLLGERSIAIIPRVIKTDIPPVRVTAETEVLYANQGGAMEDTLVDIGEAVSKAEAAIDQVLSILESNRSNIDQAIVNIRKVTGNVNVMLERANETDFVGNFSRATDKLATSLELINVQLERANERKLMDTVSDVVENVRGITGAINQPESLKQIVANIELLSASLGDVANSLQGSWPKIDVAIDDISTAAVSARAMMQSGNKLLQDAGAWLKPTFEGKGSIGKIISSEDLYTRLTGVMTKADTMMNDINHYGLLFHLNRTWQRSRTKRANDLAELATSRDFKTYFQEEMDRMNTSVARVAVLLEEAEDQHRKQDMMADGAFTKAWAELLRNVDGLASTIRMYNESLTEEQQPTP